MKGVRFLTALAFFALASFLASAYDPSPLQDFCVAIQEPSGAFVNGKFCKNPKLVTADDFFFQGLNTPANTNASKLGFGIKPVFADQLPGLNSLGVSMARLDFAVGGVAPPHIHPRATEMVVVTEGTLLAGFVASSQNNALFTKILNPGDVFVFPIGQIHFLYNIGKVNAVAFAAISSQNPGVILIPFSVFGSNLPIKEDILAKSFQVNVDVIKQLEKPYGQCLQKLREDPH